MPNNNLPMLDLPKWEQMPVLPAATAAGISCADDNARYIYFLFSATAFYRIDSWTGLPQQLANPPAGAIAAGSCLRYVIQMGGQRNGKTYGSVYALRANGTSVVFSRYDEATDAWSALSVANIPAALGTDARLICPEPALNGYEGGYHSAVALNTITTTALANANATSIAVAALPLSLPAGARLNFGTVAAPIWAVLTSAAAAGATSITVAALIAAVPNAAVAYWYADMFLVGNNATQMYRYNIATNVWSTTSANAANPALPALTATIGAGTVACWLPASGDVNALNTIIVVRGGGTNNIYEYNFLTNTVSIVSYYPFTELINTGTSSAVRSNAVGKSKSLLLRLNNSSRIFEFTRADATMTPLTYQYLIGEGNAVVGDKMSYLRSPDGKAEFVYLALNSSNQILRCGLTF